ncbi:hypothetical protein Hanom_Chr09g00784371 [Helianthus anomalus]
MSPHLYFIFNKVITLSTKSWRVASLSGVKMIRLPSNGGIPFLQLDQYYCCRPF